jgi:hypothetical protein
MRVLLKPLRKHHREQRAARRKRDTGHDGDDTGH